ncbi:MAG: hypothetical protein WBN22_06110 [Verrucomicrobiia bacterium]
MKTRYRLTRRGSRGDTFYFVDTVARKHHSLHTTDEHKALQIVEAKNLAERQPETNLQIAKACLAATDENFINRTWREVMAEFIKTKTGNNRTRSERAVMDKSFDTSEAWPHEQQQFVRWCRSPRRRFNHLDQAAA